MLLEVERDKAITDRVILLQKIIRGFKDRYVPRQLRPPQPGSRCVCTLGSLCSHLDTRNRQAHRGAHVEMGTHLLTHTEERRREIYPGSTVLRKPRNSTLSYGHV